MAVPKKRVSKQRKRKRRTHYKAAEATLATCSQTGDPKLRHRVVATGDSPMRAIVLYSPPLGPRNEIPVGPA